jgi:hypothetical protein
MATWAARSRGRSGAHATAAAPSCRKARCNNCADGVARECIDALLAEHAKRADVERAFERAGEPVVGIGLALGPQAQRAGAHEHLGVAGAAGLQLGRGADLLGLRR